LPLNAGFPRLLENPGKSWIFTSKISRTSGKSWKMNSVLEKSWKLNYGILECPGIYLWFKLRAGIEKLLPVQNTMCK